MTDERKLAVVILVLALAMPIVFYWSFSIGYKLYPEVRGMIHMVVPSHSI